MIQPAAYASERDLRDAIRENAEVYEHIQVERAHELVEVIIRTYGVEALADEVRAWQDKVISDYAHYLWTVESHNYRASRSELREAHYTNEGMRQAA